MLTFYDHQTSSRSSQQRNSNIANNNKKPSLKTLPDFNEAFGSTERGRFQSPPDPNRIMGTNKRLLEFFFEETLAQPMKFEEFQF